MPEYQTKSVEQIFSTSSVAQEYFDIADARLSIFSEAENILKHSKNTDNVTPESLDRVVRHAAEDEIQRWSEESEGNTERLEQLLKISPRQTERLIEMAWEIRQLSTVDIYTISSDGLAQRKTRQTLNNDDLVINAKEYADKYNLDQPDIRILVDLLKLDQEELDKAWYGFEAVANQAATMEHTRKHVEKDLEDKAKADAEQLEKDKLELKRQQGREKAEDAAVSVANVIRYEAKKALWLLDSRAAKRGAYSVLDGPYEDFDSRSRWAAAPIADFLETHSDRRRKEYKEKWPVLQEELLSQIVGQVIIENIKSEVGLNRNDYFINKIKTIALVENPRDPNLTLSPDVLRRLGASLLADYRKRQNQMDARRQKQQAWIHHGREVVNNIDRALDEVAAKVIEFATTDKPKSDSHDKAA